MPDVTNEERIAMITDVTQKIAAGNFSSRIHISDKMDEIDALSACINMLAEELGTRDDRIKKQIEELEKFNKMFIDRELKMSELKQEISELRKEIATLGGKIDSR
jgi:predicted  nucleic acid-binding Zn-ribbon protein